LKVRAFKRKDLSQEKKILWLLKQNPQAAVAEIYNLYADNVFGLCFKILLSEEEAEDIMQDIFLKVWKNAQKYDSNKGSLFTWLLNITRNTAIDRLRSADFRRQQQNLNTLETVYISSKSEMHSVQSLDVKDHVFNLEPKLHHVIDLIYFKGYTQQETSKILNIPLGTVKTRIRNAMQILRKIYKEI
jgi:RNA polymerase sigma-70 factor (ECF subfamily)